MSGQIIKVSVSVAAVATSAVSLFAISWIGLALLGFKISYQTRHRGTSPAFTERAHEEALFR
jgi:hypothetical protein